MSGSPRIKVVCPYCDRETKLVTGNKIYPHRKDLYHHHFWQCAPCEAHVGVHKGTIKPLGSPANGHTRNMRSQAHNAFDPLWRTGPFKGMNGRYQAYKWLADQLGIAVQNCHIGMFDVEQCTRVISICKEYRELLRRGPDVYPVDDDDHLSAAGREHEEGGMADRVG
ncbi:MAG: hypothetical protein E6Q97_33955 [Desulfurellales bacterium]|nr:MAG: hypothetical protein E6Q97_33955 [Desulfurellales bacterium]